MSQTDKMSRLEAKLTRPVHPGGDPSWAFAVLPKDVCEKLPRRGSTTVDGAINGHRFRATLGPDGQLSHWLRVGRELCEATGIRPGSLGFLYQATRTSSIFRRWTTGWFG
jgi:hypothetical protein